MVGQYVQPKKKLKNFYVKYTLIVLGVLFGVMLLIQICYPSSNLPLNTKIGGKNLSGWDKKAAIKELDRLYENAEIEVFLGDSEDSYKTTFPEHFGLEVDNTSRVNAISYPWYARIIPTSLFWWGADVGEENINLNFDEDVLGEYVEKTFGTPCYIEPKNASLTVDGTSLNIGKSNIGGACYQSEIKDGFRNTEFISSTSGSVRVDLNTEMPDVTTEDATKLAMDISPNLVNDLVFEFDEMEDTVTLGHDELASWVSFEVKDKKLTPKIDEKASSEFYKTRVAPMVEQSAGVTTIIATEDMSAVRLDGVEGRVINIKETNLRIAEYLQGLRKTVAIALESTDPSINYVYTRPEEEQAQSEVNTEPNENIEPTQNPDTTNNSNESDELEEEN